MDELVMRNEELGITLNKCQVNGVDVVWAEDIRKALKWDTVYNMTRGLKDEKEVIKIHVKDLDSTFSDLLSNLKTNQTGRGRQMQYAYFITRQGVSRLIATRRPHDIKDDPELAEWLDRLQDWIFGEVLPEAFATGSYLGKPFVAGKHAIDGVPKSLSEALRMMADEYDAHELTINAMHNVQQRAKDLQLELDEAIKTKAQISTSREASALGQLSALTAKIKRIQYQLEQIQSLAKKYIDWCNNISLGKSGKNGKDDQFFLIDDACKVKGEIA